MRLAVRIAIILLLLPAAELLAFLLVAWKIGFFPAIGLMLLTSLAGVLVLRRVSGGQFGQFRRMLREREVDQAALRGRGPLVALGGILLLLPGFITDLGGLGLLVPPIRRWFGAALGGALQRGARPGDPRVIDLAPTEWRALPDRKPRRPPQRNP
jgi:UPF0716 protein FxsA